MSSGVQQTTTQTLDNLCSTRCKPLHRWLPEQFKLPSREGVVPFVWSHSAKLESFKQLQIDREPFSGDASGKPSLCFKPSQLMIILLSVAQVIMTIDISHQLPQTKVEPLQLIEDSMCPNVISGYKARKSFHLESPSIEMSECYSEF